MHDWWKYFVMSWFTISKKKKNVAALGRILDFVTTFPEWVDLSSIKPLLRILLNSRADNVEWLKQSIGHYECFQLPANDES